MLRPTIFALLGALSLSACAAEPGSVPAARAAAAPKPAAAPVRGLAAPRPAAAPAAAGIPVNDAAIRAAVAEAIPGVKIDRIQPSQIPGYREVALSGRVVYVSNDGKLLIQGSLIRLADRHNLTDDSEAQLRRGVLAAVPRERRIVFAAAKPRYHVTVFTDIDCGYCRKLHSQMAAYNAAGITIDYLFFPRAGVNSESYDKAVAVWCSRDQRKALTDAKLDRPIAKRTCANPVAADYALGQRVGVDGTPAVYLDDGSQIGGYLSPEDMLARLQRDDGAPSVAAAIAGQ